MLRLFLAFLAILTLWLAGCGGSDFGIDSIKEVLEAAPISLSGEQVTLSAAQVDCGVQSELWNPPSGNMAQLTQKGRDLKFSDDVRTADPDINVPYTQITGSFPVVVTDVSKLRDADNGMKLADVKMGVVIVHDCFPKPLPLMGVRKGKFSPGAPVVFRFAGGGKEMFTVDKLVH